MLGCLRILFFQAGDGIRDRNVTGVQTCALPIFFAAGTGNPYFSTDTTAALRAAEIEAEVILMAKSNVDGVYSDDPQLNKQARKYDNLTYMDMLNEGLGVMDSTASSLCMDNDIPLIVFSLMDEGNNKKVVLGETIGTKIRGK